MKENLLSALKAHDFTAIRTICFALSEEERTATLALFEYHTIKALLTDELKKQGITYIPKSIDTILSYALMCLCRNAEELKAAEINIRIRYLDKEHYYYFLDTQYAVPLLELLQSPKGAYLQEIIEKMYKAYPMEMSFEILWTLYKHKRIAFNGELMMFNLHYRFDYERKKIALAKYLLQNPETATEIFHLVPIYLKDARFNAKETLEMYEYLIQGGFFADRTIISLFIEGLLNPLKKNTADFFCRVVELLNPTAKELLTSQHTLFALLSSDKTSVVNFVMKLIKEISSEKDFDFQSFADNFALCFATQKIAKSQLIGLSILENSYKKQAPINPDYREQLAVLFTVPDVKLQEKVASLLTTYFGGEGLAEVVAPYQDYLKGKAQDLLATLSPSESSAPSDLSDRSTSSENSQTACAARTSRTPLSLGEGSEERILFLIGDCIREKSAATIDVFFDALVRLQEQIPADYTEQIKPYLKQLLAREWFVGTMPLLYHFLDSWSSQSPTPLVYDTDKEWKEIQKLYKEDKYTQADKLDKPRVMHIAANQAQQTFPYLFNKIARTLQKLKEKDTLPFLSTPTHEPFYIEAEVLVDKLLQYEAQGKSPDLDDLIVACNRLLFWEVSAAAKEKAQQLKGDYAPAIQYYLGLTDKIQLNEALLPLWTQITRLKHPDEEFKVFENTQAKNILSVVKPFYIRYGWEKRTYANGEVGEEFTYHCNHYYKYGKDKSRPTLYNYYNANEGKYTSAQEAEYKLSLNPHYPDALLCAYITKWATYNEADDIRDMTLPLEAVLRYDLRVRHSGWLYIGACLLFEKRPSRDLAYEYICQAIAREEDLTHLKTYLARVLAWDYLPIPRFIEFLDRPNPPAVKAFGKEVVQLYLEEVKKQDKLPRNHKKLAAFND